MQSFRASIFAFRDNFVEVFPAWPFGRILKYQVDACMVRFCFWFCHIEWIICYHWVIHEVGKDDDCWRGSPVHVCIFIAHNRVIFQITHPSKVGSSDDGRSIQIGTIETPAVWLRQIRRSLSVQHWCASASDTPTAQKVNCPEQKGQLMGPFYSCRHPSTSADKEIKLRLCAPTMVFFIIRNDYCRHQLVCWS